MASRGRPLLAGLFLLSGCPLPEDDKATPETTPDTTTAPDSEDSPEPTESESTTESPPESGIETGTTPDWTDPAHDWDGDGFTEDNGDCNDRDPDAYPGAIETCPDWDDEDCDGLTDEECHTYTAWFSGTVKFDSVGLIEVVRIFEARNEAGEVICTDWGVAYETAAAPECPECLWTFGQHRAVVEGFEGKYCATLCPPDGDCGKGDTSGYLDPVAFAEEWTGAARSSATGPWSPAMLGYHSTSGWLAYWATADDGGDDTLSLLEILEYDTYTVASFSDMENYWGLYWYYSADI